MSAPVVKTWKDDTAGISQIERLDFPSDKWTKLDLLISGHKNKSTGVHLEVIVDGRPWQTYWDVVNGTEQVSHCVKFPELAGQSFTILVKGYITNHAVLLGGGATITATASRD